MRVLRLGLLFPRQPQSAVLTWQCTRPSSHLLADVTYGHAVTIALHNVTVTVTGLITPMYKREFTTPTTCPSPATVSQVLVVQREHMESNVEIIQCKTTVVHAHLKRNVEALEARHRRLRRSEWGPINQSYQETFISMDQADFACLLLYSLLFINTTTLFFLIIIITFISLSSNSYPQIISSLEYLCNVLPSNIRHQ